VVAKEAKLQAALDWLLEGTSVTATQPSAFLDEVDGKKEACPHPKRSGLRLSSLARRTEEPEQIGITS
jgi:hypothetical protein